MLDPPRGVHMLQVKRFTPKALEATTHPSLICRGPGWDAVQRERWTGGRQAGRTGTLDLLHHTAGLISYVRVGIHALTLTRRHHSP